MLLEIICILLSSKEIWTRSSFWLNENILYSLWYKIEFYDKAKPLTLSFLSLIVFAFRCLDNGINWQSACASWWRDDERMNEKKKHPINIEGAINLSMKHPDVSGFGKYLVLKKTPFRTFFFVKLWVKHFIISLFNCKIIAQRTTFSFSFSFSVR